MQRQEQQTMKSIIEGDIAYLQGLCVDIEKDKETHKKNIEKTKLLNKQLKLITRQLNALQEIIDTKVLPRFYISCETYKRYSVEGVLPKAATNETEKYLYFAKKEPRQQEKLQSTSFNTSVLKQPKNLPKTRLTIMNARHDKVMTLTLEHADKYPKGGNSKKVKKCVSENGMTYALKKYKHRTDDNRLRFALTSSYFAAKMNRPDYVIQYGNDIYFLTGWYDDIKYHHGIEQKFKTQLQCALDVAYEVALLHNDDVLSLDLKPANMIRTPKSAHTIDHDDAAHLLQVEAGQKIQYTTRYWDNSIVLKFVETYSNAKNQAEARGHKLNGSVITKCVQAGREAAIAAFKKQAKLADVYGLGFMLGSIFTDIVEFNELTAREFPARIHDLIDNNPYMKSRCKRRAYLYVPVGSSNGNKHSEIKQLLLSATHQVAEERQADATIIYNTLRRLATETYGFKKHELPPELPASNSLGVYNDLEEIRKNAEISTVACIVNHFNHHFEFQSQLPETAVRYDYHTTKNLRFVKRLHQLQRKKLPQLDLTLTTVPLQATLLEAGEQVDLADMATLRQAISDDRAYLLRLQSDIDTKSHKVRLLHSQFVASRNKMQQTLDAKILPRFYVSLSTGKTFAHLPASLKKTSHVTNDDVLVGIKEPRAQHKLFDTEARETNKPDLPRSILKLQNHHGETVLRLALEHRSAYASGGNASKVKCGSDTSTRKQYALKQYAIDDNADRAFRLCQGNQYFSRRLGREAYTCLFAGKLHFITDWIPSIAEKPEELSLEQQLKYALWVAYEIARLHKDNVLVFDIKIENFILTEDRAELIDMENFVHQDDVENTDDLCWSPASLDDACALEIFRNAGLPRAEFNKQKKRFDVYALGLTLGMILTKIKKHQPVESTAPEIIDAIRAMPQFARYNYFSRLESTPLAAQHQQLNELIDKATNQDYTKRQASAVELYIQLRDIAVAKYGFKPDALPPVLPFLSNSSQVRKDLQAIYKKTFNPMASTISHLNQTVGDSDMPAAKATRYQDYQTFQNAKMRQQIAAHADVIKHDVIHIQLPKDKEDEDVSVNERPSPTSRTSLRSELLSTTRELSDLLDSGALSVDQFPRVNIVESYHPDVNQEKINDQFKKLVRLITERAPNMKKNHAKYKALKDFNNKIQDHQITSDQLPKLAKIFLHLGMSQVRINIFDTTEIGKDCRLLLNAPKFKALRNALFKDIPEGQPIRYSDMRKLVHRSNDASFFGSHNTPKILENWQSQFDNGGNIADLANIDLYRKRK